MIHFSAILPNIYKSNLNLSIHFYRQFNDHTMIEQWKRRLTESTKMEAEGVSTGLLNLRNCSNRLYLFPASKHMDGCTMVLRVRNGNWVHKRSCSGRHSAHGPLGSGRLSLSSITCTSSQIPGCIGSYRIITSYHMDLRMSSMVKFNIEPSRAFIKPVPVHVLFLPSRYGSLITTWQFFKNKRKRKKEELKEFASFFVDMI